MKFLPLIAAIIICGLAYGLYAVWNAGYAVGYKPDQPIPFSHKIHAGERKIPCLYCHTGADKQKHALVPSVSTCINCHHPEGAAKDSEWTAKIREHYIHNKPIEWIKVHDNDDFVYFSHKRHVSKGVECSTCHGPIETMDTVEQVVEHNMGFCMDCHRDNELGIQAPVECSTCHQ